MTVKNLKLEDSLEQFVNGEILEGDNAYFCEKCNERVSLVYRRNLGLSQVKCRLRGEERKTSHAASGSRDARHAHGHVRTLVLRSSLRISRRRETGSKLGKVPYTVPP